MRRSISSLAFVIVTMFIATAHAQGDEAYEEFKKANELAGAGAVTRSIPHYQKVVELAPERYSLAFFNLGEVWRAKGECEKAAVMYRFYLMLGSDEATKKASEKAFDTCRKGKDWPTLTVKITPSETATVYLDGYLFGRGDAVADVVLPPGTYEIEARAVDHIPQKKTVQLGGSAKKKAGKDAGKEAAKESTEAKAEDEAKVVEFDLEEKTFYGKILVKVNIAGAKIKIHKGPGEDAPLLDEYTAPMRQPIKVEEGRHFVEVTKEGFDRWIRNANVRRDEDTVVDVTLSKGLPEELRRK